MNKRFALGFTATLMACLTTGFAPNFARAESHDRAEPVVVSLPPDIAQMLRERNLKGRGGCDESSIFIHGYRVLRSPTDRTIWFLGAPDYLCDTKSFVSAMVDINGRWTVGQEYENGESGSRMLEGVPNQFHYSPEFGYFLTTARKVAGLLNYFYHSTDGKTWQNVELPHPTRKTKQDDCCDNVWIDELCLSDSGDVFISYAEDETFASGVWSSSVDGLFPANITWTQVSHLPEVAYCDRQPSPTHFLPRSLRRKSDDGAIFEVSADFLVRMPGSTK